MIGVTIPAHRRPVVTFKIADAKGQPIELSDLDEDGIRFTVATIQSGANGESRYHNYILTKVSGREYAYKNETKKPVLAETLQPDFDQSGVQARSGPGTFTYAFKSALPSSYERKRRLKLPNEIASSLARHMRINRGRRGS